MSTTIIEAPPVPAVLPPMPNKGKLTTDIGNKFRQAADPNNESGRNPKPVTEAPKTPEPVAPPAKVESAVPAEVKVESKTENNPTEGFQKTIEKAGDKETNLANLRKAREEAEARASQFEARAKELEAKIPHDYEQIKAQREELEKAVERFSVEASPRFKEKYDKPQEALLNGIKKSLAVTDANPEEFVSIVQMPESKERATRLSDMIEGLDAFSRGKVTTSIAEYDRLREARQSEISNPSQTFQQIQQEQANLSKVQREQNLILMKDTIEKARKGIEWFKPIEGNESWNEKIQKIERQALSFWTENHSPAELAQLTLAGSMAPMYAEALSLHFSEIQKLNEELAQYRKATPANSAGASTSTETGGKKPAGAIEAFRNATRRS